MSVRSAYDVKTMDIRSHLDWIESRVMAKCKKCNRRTTGTMYAVPSQPLRAMDGGTAYPIIWICDYDYHHIRRPGYTKPVDFTEILGKAQIPGEIDGMPDFNASDEDWEDWSRECQKEKDMVEKENRMRNWK